MRRILPLAGRLLLTVLCLAAAALPALYTRSLYGYLPVLLLASALLLSLLWVLLLRRGLRAEPEAEDGTCPRGGSMDIRIRVQNRTPLLCPKLEARVSVSDERGEDKGEHSFLLTLGGREETVLPLKLDMRHIGCYTVSLSDLRAFGFFGLFSLTVPCGGRLEALVTPRLSDLAELELTGAETRDSSRDSRVTVIGGTDYTGVREYAQGDPMKQIHWKLSAHTLDYLTKLQESSRRQEYSIILDFALEKQPERERLLELSDCLIETALSMGSAVVRREGEYTLLYADQEGRLCRSLPGDDETINALLHSFAYGRADPGPEFPDGAAILRREGSTANRASNLLAVTGRVTEELLQELVTVKRQGRSPELYFVYPAAWTSRERELMALRLRTLDEAEIPYAFISAGEGERI